MSLSEVERARVFMLDLAKSFFMGEPTEEKLRIWEEALGRLAGNTGYAPLEEALSALQDKLARKTLAELREEYHLLFEDPFAEPISTAASYYLDGKNYGPSLARLRKILQQLGFYKDENFKEPEDSLVCLLDFLISLIYARKEEAMKAQGEILEEFLLPCVKGMRARVVDRFPQGFFAACLAFLEAYLEMERCLLMEEG